MESNSSIPTKEVLLVYVRHGERKDDRKSPEFTNEHECPHDVELTKRGK